MIIKNSMKEYFRGIISNGVFNHNIAINTSNGQIFKQQQKITKEHLVGVLTQIYGDDT